jgi:hypothetical protein
VVPNTEPWRYCGKGVSFHWDDFPARLIFRTNDDLPGNGNGEFRLTLQVQRVR